MNNRNFYRMNFADLKSQVMLSFNEKEKYCIIDEGTKFYDVIRYQDTHNFAISDKIVEILQKYNLTGWESSEIDILNNNQKYHKINIIGKSGDIDRSTKGELVGINIVMKTWDGSDIFIPNNTRMKLCTAKFRDVFLNEKINNVAFENINQIKWYCV